METYQYYIDDIQSAVYSPETADPDFLRDSAAQYAEACAEVNDRLREVTRLLHRGLRSEALQLAEEEPNLLDMVASLDFPELPTWTEMLKGWGMAPPPPLLIELAADINQAYADQQPLEYSLSLHPDGHAYTIYKEVLSQHRQNYTEPFKHIESAYGDIRYFDVDEAHLVRPVWEHDPLESSLSQVPKMFREPEDLRRAVSSVTQYHVLDVGPRAPVKLPQQMKPAKLPGADGEDLVPFLYNLRESNRDRYFNKKCRPNLVDLCVPRAELESATICSASRYSVQLSYRGIELTRKIYRISHRSSRKTTAWL